jgi:hypothetical protein
VPGAAKYCVSTFLLTANCPLLTAYSVLRLFTGFIKAALMAWKLIVKRAIANAKNPAIPNTHQLIFTRYAKSCSQLCIITHDTGAEITNDIITRNRKSFDNINTTFCVDAPRT